MSALLEKCKELNDIALEMSVIVATEIEDSLERGQLLREIDTLVKYGIHNLQKTIEHL